MTFLRGPFLILGAACMIAGCVVAEAPRHPAQAAGQALGYTVASPLLILKGLTEGIGSTAQVAKGDLKAMNEALVKAKAPVDLARTYRYAYGTDLATAPADGNTGQVFRHLGAASRHFQDVLRGYGIGNARDYYLTAVRTADAQGYTLYAVVYRPEQQIRVVVDGRQKTLTPEDDAFYRPYAQDARGAALDLVLDWAAVPRTEIRTQKDQAVLMTIGANSVLINRRSNDFWAVEAAWRNGDFRRIANEKQQATARLLG
ncbi:MAG: hypothetical protein AAF557_27600 [Pseudomonadota bacterium]